MLYRLTSMAVFVSAADLGSFTATGKALGLTSQMVGKHVGQLEARLGAPLQQRTTRRQSLTEVGRLFYKRCRVVLAEAEAADTLVEGMSSNPRGRLRVSAPVGFGACRLAPAVSTLNSRPNLRRCIPHLRFHHDTLTRCPRNRQQPIGWFA